jgi:hypothetical protein
MATTPVTLDEQQQQAPPDQAAAPVDYGEFFEKLPVDRVGSLKTLVRKFDVRDQWARQIEILRVTLLRFFWIGLQHAWWDNDLGAWQVGPQGGLAVRQENLNEEPTFREDFNLFTPYGKSFIAVFSQNSAPVRMEPDQPRDAASIDAAKEAQKYVRVYEKYNDPKLQQMEIGRLLWTDGRVLAETDTIPDERFGRNPDGTPREGEVTEFFGNLESKVPIYETCPGKWPYAKLSKDHDVCYLRDKYAGRVDAEGNDLGDKIAIGSKTSSPNEEMARMGRIATAENVTQLSQDTLKYLVTEDRWYLAKSAFRELEDADRDFFLELFPQGCTVTFCGDTYVGASPKSMSKHLAVMHGLPGTGQSRPSMGDPEVAIQMEYNDAMNLGAECLKYAIPSIWADMDEVTIRAIQEQKAQYGSIHPLKTTRGTGEPMENLFYAEPSIEPPGMFVEWVQNLQGPLSQFVTGQQPALFGAQMEDQKTARGYAQARDQALGMMGIVWQPFKSFYAQLCQQAAECGAARAQETPKMSAVVSAGRPNKTETIDVDLGKMGGGFLCSPKSDENFPESPTQKSNKILMAVQAAPTNPVLAKLLQQPDNLALVRDYGIGVEEFVIEEVDSRDKQLAEWAEMLEGQGPVADAEQTMANVAAAGQLKAQGVQLPDAVPLVQRSSIPIDPDTDNHPVEAEECLRILNSAEGQQVKKERPEIWLDLKLHWQQHVQAFAQKMAVMQPPAPTPGPAGPHPAPQPPKGAQPNAAPPA